MEISDLASEGMTWGDFLRAFDRWRAGDEQAAEEPVLAEWLCTAAETARRRGVSERTIRRRIAAGKEVCRPGRRGGRRLTLICVFLDETKAIAEAFDERRMIPWSRIVEALLEHYGEAKLKSALGMTKGNYYNRGNQQIYGWIRGALPSEHYREKLLELTHDEKNNWGIGPGSV